VGVTQKAKPDLVNWLRPTLAVKRKTEFERRVVEPWEYSKLAETLLNPPLAPSRRAERKALWREAGDTLQLLRLTGGRLNEIVRIRLDQFHWSKGVVTLYATKTENERDIPLWGTIPQIIQSRIREGLTDDELLFPRQEPRRSTTRLPARFGKLRNLLSSTTVKPTASRLTVCATPSALI